VVTLIESPSLVAELGKKAYAGMREHCALSSMARRVIEA
jgi:hypothetical protein